MKGTVAPSARSAQAAATPAAGNARSVATRAAMSPPFAIRSARLPRREDIADRHLLPSAGEMIERLRQIGDEVVRMLEPDRQPEEAGRRGGAGPFDRSAVLDQALGGPEAGRVRER